MPLSKLLIALCLTLVSCAGMDIADVRPTITLPASGDCYGVTVLTKQKVRHPKSVCDEMKKRGVFLSQEDWKKQKISIQKNCQLKKCKQLVGVFDELFLTIDSALKKLP